MTRRPGGLAGEGLEELRYPEAVAELAAKLDHTDLRPTSGDREIFRLCSEAAEYGFASVCVAPRWVPFAVRWLSGEVGASVQVCAVVGFPHGNTTTRTKTFEAAEAADAGAAELDMVISIGDLKARNLKVVSRDVAAVVEAAHERAAIVKAILETGFLSREEIELACRLVVSAGASFVKTSTGFGPDGADPETVQLMRRTVGPNVGVKASGGIRTLSAARRMLAAGASRLGSSSSVAILEELLHEQSR